MKKMNPPSHRTRIIVIIRPIVEPVNYTGEWRTVDKLGEYPDDWIKPSTKVPPIDPFSGACETVSSCIGNNNNGSFRAKRNGDSWEILKYLPHTYYNERY
jgi:hypothetical protein